MIIEYLADNLGCNCGGKSLADAIGDGAPSSVFSAITGPAQAAKLGATSEPATVMPPVDNSRAFAPLMAPAPPPPAERRPCKNCGGGRGDVNVNVNVATGTNSSTGPANANGNGAAPSFEGRGSAASPAERPPSVDPSQIERVARDEAQKVIAEARPSFEQPAKVEYRPFAVPQDRIVKQVEYRPFAVVWDRIKKAFVDRDVNHPIDRVRTVPAKVVKSSFEGGK